MGYLYQRGRVWWCKYYRNGVCKQESTGTTDKRTARDEMRKREGDGAYGKPVVSHPEKLTFDVAVKAVQDDYRLKNRKSADALKRRIKKHLSKFFGGQRMTDISTVMCNDYATRRLDAGASIASVNRELAIVKRAFSLALEAGLLYNPPKIKMQPEHNARTGFFERGQFEAVRSHLPAALRPVVTFAFFSGWRIPSEVLRLEWRHVDRTAGEIALDAEMTKGRAARTLPYHKLPELVTLIEAQWDDHVRLRKAGSICRYVFQRNGKQIRDFRTSWDNAITAAACPGRIPHDFRRTAVRNLVRAGVSEKIAMEITGHKTRSVFERYNIVNEQDKAEGLGKLAAGTVAGTNDAETARERGSA